MKIGYGRVSTRDQNPDGQRDQLTAAGCERVFIDTASGKLAHRPALDDALGHLRSGDTLVITKLDRLGRSLKNLLELAGQLQDQGVELVVLDQGIDTTTPAGRLFFHLIASFAEFEHALIVERTCDGLAAARARGRKGGTQPKLTALQVKMARRMANETDENGRRVHTIQAIADTLGVSPAHDLPGARRQPAW